MKPKENIRFPNTLSPPPVHKTLHLGNVEFEYATSGKRQLSPSNHSYNPQINVTISQFLKDGQHSGHNEKLSKKPNFQLTDKIQKLQQQQKDLKKTIEQLRVENNQLMLANQSLKIDLFTKQSQKSNVHLLEQQLVRYEKMITGLQKELQQKTQFIHTQKVAKEYNAGRVDDMRFEIKQIHDLYQSEKAKIKQLNLKIKKGEQEHLKTKKKVKDLQKQLLQKTNRQNNISARLLQKQNQNFKEKIKVLTGINDRQMKQIVDLMSALDSKGQVPSTTTMNTSQPKPQQSNIFQHEYSSIMHRCNTETDTQQYRIKINQLQSNVTELKNQNAQLKLKINFIKDQNGLQIIDDLQIEKQQYEKQLKQQHCKIVNLNQQLYQQNHQIYTLKDQCQHYFQLKQQLQQSNNRLANQLKQVYDEKMKYLKLIPVLQQKVKQIQKIQQDYDVLSQEFSIAQEQIKQNEQQIKQLSRKNQQLLIYVEQLRTQQLRLNQQLIERNYQIEQLKSIKTDKVISQPFITNDQRKIQSLLQERNLVFIKHHNKFKKSIIDELQMMSLEMVMALSRTKNQQTIEIIGKVRRRLDSVLEI